MIKKYLKIPNSIFIDIKNYTLNYYLLIIKSPLGVIKKFLKKQFKLYINNNYLIIYYKKNKKSKLNSIIQTLFTIIKKQFYGLLIGFTLILILKGKGFQINLTSNNIILNLGYSHTIKIFYKKTIRYFLLKNEVLKLQGLNQQQLKETLYFIKKYQKPNLYTLKGFFYLNEFLKKKTGKKKDL